MIKKNEGVHNWRCSYKTGDRFRISLLPLLPIPNDLSNESCSTNMSSRGHAELRNFSELIPGSGELSSHVPTLATPQLNWFRSGDQQSSSLSEMSSKLLHLVINQKNKKLQQPVMISNTVTSFTRNTLNGVRTIFAEFNDNKICTPWVRSSSSMTRMCCWRNLRGTIWNIMTLLELVGASTDTSIVQWS